ncbi:DMT family transporter [Gorillibacterium timonense]|uniref:DMT family transporter n=1 Tax=Gorillibacterium timonense TaxID=1689269 RepID=UPI0009EC3FC9|nr:DMT family transporter [Gorillibacterium timonense]
MTQKKADLLLALISMAWGSSYLLMKLGLNHMGPFNLISLRFGIAFLLTALLFRKRMARTDRRTIGYGALLGLLLFGLFAFLMFGLKTTSASTAGFLTSATVVFVPLLQMLITRRKPELPVAAGAVLALTGIALLSLNGRLTLSGGALLCLAGAFTYAWQIIATNRMTHKADGLLLGIYQLGFAGLYGLIGSLIFEHPALPASRAEWTAVLGLAIVCSAFGFVLQPVAQKHTTPERTGLLFTLEPVFTALFAYLFLHEVLQARGYLGAGLVLAGVVVSGIKRKPRTVSKGSMDEPRQRFLLRSLPFAHLRRKPLLPANGLSKKP